MKDEFEHERDARCSYFEEMSKRCRASGEGQQHCKVLRKLLRRCPGDERPQEVERIERSSEEDTNEVLAPFSGGLGGFMSPFGGQGDDGIVNGDGLFMDPFEMMQRSLDEMFRGRFSFGEFGEEDGPFSVPPERPFKSPPHHRHRYEPQDPANNSGNESHKEKAPKHWENYQSEDI